MMEELHLQINFMLNNLVIRHEISTRSQYILCTLLNTGKDLNQVLETLKKLCEFFNCLGTQSWFWQYWNFDKASIGGCFCHEKKVNFDCKMYFFGSKLKKHMKFFIFVKEELLCFLYTWYKSLDTGMIKNPAAVCIMCMHQPHRTFAVGSLYVCSR